HQAKTLLFDKPTSEVMAAVDAWVAALAPTDPQFEQLLVHAIGICEGHETLRPALLNRLLSAEDFRARAYATRVIGNWGTRLADPLSMLRRQIQDPHPRVRLEAIVACSYIPSAEAAAVATQALDRPRDRFIDYALAQTVNALGPSWYPTLAGGALPFAENPEHLRFALESEGAKETAGLVRKLAERPGLDGQLRERILALLAAVGSGADLRYALDAAPGSQAVLQELITAASVHRRKPTGDLTVPVRRLIADASPALRPLGLTLAGAWGIAEASDAIRAELSRTDNDERILVAALGASPALLGPETVRRARPLAVSTAPLAVRTASIAAMAAVELTAAARTVTELLSDVKTEADMNQLLAPILNRKDGAAALTQAWQTRPPAADAARLIRRALNNSGRSDVALMNALHRVVGIENELPAYDPAFVRSLAEVSMKQGDAQRGRAVYFSNLSSCAACHKLDGKGGEAGPDLTLVGAGRSPELLIESLLWPNRQIREGYLATTITTKAGEQFTGYKTRETPNEWQLRDPAANQTHRIAKADVEQIKDTGSLMPEGLTAGLTRDELHDLIRFLADQGRVSTSP
ncbi:MAG: c-type cytochrome, partial [Verrucomicrobia bacterium]|nr:c-type cytochrome [Verrucomicrobiota bacterium]